jgi:hypothetical protein
MNFHVTTANENPVLFCFHTHQHKVGLDWCCEPAIKYGLDVRKHHRLSLPLWEARRVASARRTSAGVAHCVVMLEGQTDGDRNCLLLWDRRP